MEESEFAESKSSSGETGSQQKPSKSAPSAADDGFMNIPDDIDLDFN